jgi:hypothetical protein
MDVNNVAQGVAMPRPSWTREPNMKRCPSKSPWRGAIWTNPNLLTGTRCAHTGAITITELLMDLAVLRLEMRRRDRREVHHLDVAVAAVTSFSQTPGDRADERVATLQTHTGIRLPRTECDAPRIRPAPA